MVWLGTSSQINRKPSERLLFESGCLSTDVAVVVDMASSLSFSGQNVGRDQSSLVALARRLFLHPKISVG